MWLFRIHRSFMKIIDAAQWKGERVAKSMERRGEIRMTCDDDGWARSWPRGRTDAHLSRFGVPGDSRMNRSQISNGNPDDFT